MMKWPCECRTPLYWEVAYLSKSPTDTELVAIELTCTKHRVNWWMPAIGVSDGPPETERPLTPLPATTSAEGQQDEAQLRCECVNWSGWNGGLTPNPACPIHGAPQCTCITHDEPRCPIHGACICMDDSFSNPLCIIHGGDVRDTGAVR